VKDFTRVGSPCIQTIVSSVCLRLFPYKSLLIHKSFYYWYKSVTCWIMPQDLRRALTGTTVTRNRSPRLWNSLTWGSSNAVRYSEVWSCCVRLPGHMFIVMRESPKLCREANSFCTEGSWRMNYIPRWEFFLIYFCRTHVSCVMLVEDIPLCLKYIIKTKWNTYSVWHNNFIILPILLMRQYILYKNTWSLYNTFYTAYLQNYL